ncbi:hypothetical protein Glove_18g29 [Diversispora epigaea]|uniref:RZ-type domain-containing protein n=1 Tax=Diversispora epigaea TaxID=1348612 RepID=A0A397JLD9_9GLOM|nr:hypothetical protein Glove_18g29 [Diversispora epigaea]
MESNEEQNYIDCTKETRENANSRLDETSTSLTVNESFSVDGTNDFNISNSTKRNDLKLESSYSIFVPEFDLKKNYLSQKSSEKGIEKNNHDKTYSQIVGSQDKNAINIDDGSNTLIKSKKEFDDSNKALVSKTQNSEISLEGMNNGSTSKIISHSSSDRSSSSQSSTSTTMNRKEKKSSEEFKIVFHVHIPPDCLKLGTPIIIGNIKELGNWDSPVKLRHSNRRSISGPDTYWFSDPIRISLSNFENIIEIKYKYGIVVSPLALRKSKQIIYEGFEQETDRMLSLQNRNQYDIWLSNDYFVSDVRDFVFVEIIYNSLSPGNFKEKIIEFQSIINDHKNYAMSSSSPKFIKDYLCETRIKENRFFLLYILGFYVHERQRSLYHHFELPDSFPSSLLIDVVKHINENTFPSNARPIIATAIESLVYHNAFHVEYEWLKIFPVAPLVDPEYRFIDSLDSLRYDETNFNIFINNLKEIALSHIDDIDDEIIYTKIARWLITMCNNMESLETVWMEILGHDYDIDAQLQTTLMARVQKNIANNFDVVQLSDLFFKLPKDLGELVEETFRERILRYLQSGRNLQIYPSKHFKAIVKLLECSNLLWTPEDYINSLDFISKFTDIEMLAYFIKHLKNFLKEFDVTEEDTSEYSKICLHWYKRFMDRSNSTSASHYDNYVFFVFNYAAKLCRVVNNLEKLCENIMKIAINCVSKCPDSLIYKATSEVINLEETVANLFFEFIECKLSDSTQNADKKLLSRVRQICNNNNNEEILNVPNSHCEELLCHIMTLFRNKLLDQFDFEIIPTSFHLSLLSGGEFWRVILSARGSVESLNEHYYVLNVRRAISQLGRMIVDETIDIRLLQDLLKYDDEFLLTYFNSVSIINEDDDKEIVITEEILNVIRKKCGDYEQTFECLNSFYIKYCPSNKVTDVQDFIQDLHDKKNLWESTSLQMTQIPDYWESHQALEMSKFVYKYKSQIFYNIFETKIKEIDEGINVLHVVKIVLPEILNIYEERCREYKNWEELKFCNATILWRNVTDINTELNFINKFEKIEKTPNFLKTLSCLSKVKQLVQNLQQLSTVVEIFKVPREKGDWIEMALEDLDSQEIPLGKLSSITDFINSCLIDIDESSWSLIKELSVAIDFITFLREIAGHDLKNLINGVDDERLIQEDTVSSLIQVKQFLLPLLNIAPKLNLDAFLQELRKVTVQNPMLASKITLCNSNNMALQNMYANISNRGEVTKEKIQNAVKIGTYKFEWTSKSSKCKVTLSYDINKTTSVSYGINDLQDLRGRALLIAKPCASMDISTDKNSQVKDSKHIMEEFVRQVDIIQEIVNVSTRLIETGNFGYREFLVSIKGTEKMIQLSEKLQTDLKKWENLVNKAQQNHFYLTFFPARHILEFYDYFASKSSKSMENKKLCQTLVRFVNPKAKLPPKTKSHEITVKKDAHLQILNEIGIKLYNIFNKVSKSIRLLKAPGERVISDVVVRGKLFVASCTDKSRLPNVIMSLYSNHGSYPEAWQLLICTTSTTLEELSIFIKRCFLAPKHGYENHLFCMANLELLDYDLQYNLVNKIRLIKEKESDYYLALICCPEVGMHHHILDQFSDFRVTNGLNTAAMNSIYKELCPKVLCASSELSGQGKSEWIRNECFKRKRYPKSFVISDDANYVKLVKQLKEFSLRPFDCMHINIISSDYPGEVNMWLFQVLTLWVVSSNADIACIPNTHIFIEIASSFEQHLLRSVPIIECLQRTHLTWDIKNLLVTNEINSPMQIVCRYLSALELNELEENDVDFKESKEIISTEMCQQLLDKFFFEDNNPEDVSSYRFLEIFVSVFADQLMRLSSSTYFKVQNIKLMMDEPSNIRTTLVKTLLEVSKDFATRSIQTKSAQLEATSVDSIENDALGTIVNWDDSNHLLVFFLSQIPDSICALYRDFKKVPINVKTLLKGQHVSEANRKWKLDNYHKMNTKVLLEKLENIARKTHHVIEYPPYALSADNLLKMALILLRTRANIPVVICGEAGCGKTSLIGFLARVVEVQFHALNLHAGITEDIIAQFMSEVQSNAKNGEIWVFFDEINTCNHIGLLANLIAHRIYQGKSINSNIRIFAACNPYRIRTKSISEVGLQTKKFEEQSNLVYEVKPLPDQILDYVWDYGVLHQDDEKKYIQVMVNTQLIELELNHPVLSELIFASQQYIRQVEEPYSVSLRDVKRTITLIKFFHKSLQNRPPIRKGLPKYPSTMTFNLKIRSYVLALGLCYQSRLYEQTLRQEYRKKMCNIFEKEKIHLNEKEFIKIIREEQEDYINRMICPPNTAQNEALLENVLVMIVCILTRIPVFIVGAPGSSKSLAIRLVSQNLRGSDSNDEYFRKLPQVYLIPHQGSSSSTSDGIFKVFQKAQNFQETSSKEFPVISVVLLDEVGLAETSPFNPLKVLHSLLEPSYPSDGPEVSVIGISNWRLDNSKSSRALLVQRPKFDFEDLVDTAVRLLDNNETNGHTHKNSLYPLAISYSEYEQKGQKHPNFHGLRDYYALVKSLCSKELTPENMQMALARNFGGTEQFSEICQKYFGNVIDTFNNHRGWTYVPIPIEQLIHANLDDEGARHLMIIGKSDSIVNLLTYQLRQKNLDPVVIFGSQFPDDQDDYSYNILSKIMMCVEAGRPLILTDLEIIYGSLYDLWNQNYIVVGSSEDPKYYTRVALGAYANPMLYVNKNFRCILVLDEKNLPKADPPLLNRFEKQKMTINDILVDDDKELVEQLFTWTKQMSTIENLKSSFSVSHDKFTQNDLFIGFNEDETLQSLVIDMKKKYPNVQNSEILTKCKESLIAIASSDGIVRAEKSALGLDEANHWKDVYFKIQYHNHLADYFKDLLSNQDSSLYSNGHQVIVNTFSNINTDVKLCLKNLTTCQVLKLSTFKTEAQFHNQVKNFWLESSNETLIVQCDINTMNAECIKLAKFIIDQTRSEYLMKNKEQNVKYVTKHACIILHVHRDHKISFNAFNFMCGWKNVTIESLAPQEKSLAVLLDGNLSEIINTTYPFEEILQQELLWCLLCMKYPSNIKSIEHIKALSANISKSKTFINFLKMKTQELLQDNHSSRDWQYYVASNKKLLYPYSSFSAALQAHIRSIVREPIAKILCALERLSATQSYFTLEQSISQSSSQHDLQLIEFWKQMFNDKAIMNIDELSVPKSEGYLMPPVIYDLQFPFSFYFIKQIDGFKKIYEEELCLLKEDSSNIDPNTGDLYEWAIVDHIKTLSNNIISSVANLKTSPLEYSSLLYFNDFVSVICADNSCTKHISLLASIFRGRLGFEKVNDPFLLHTHWWRYSLSIMTEFRIAQLCPSIINNTSFVNENLSNNSFGNYLIEEVTKFLLKKLNDIKISAQDNIPQLINWQHEANLISILCGKLPEAPQFASLHLLQMCNDFVSADSITLTSIKEIMKIRNSISSTFNGTDIFTPNFIKKVFTMLDKLPNTRENSAPKLSFMLKCLEILSLESPSRLELYKNIFSQEPIPIMSNSIISLIFKQEENIIPKVFLELIKDSNKILSLSPRFKIITDCLKSQGLNSSISTLCCDILQKSFFSKYTFKELSDNYQYSVNILQLTNSIYLQKICAIALLKEFVEKFWDHCISDDDILKPIEFDATEIEGIDIARLIEEINNNLTLDLPLIHSLKIYFLRALRNRGLSMSDVRLFCGIQKEVLSWLQKLPWDEGYQSRLPFNPYWSIEEYVSMEKYFTTLSGMNNKGSFNSFFFNLKKKEISQASLSSIALMGLIFYRLHSIRASQNWEDSENQMAEFLQEKIEKNSTFSNIYKETISKLIKNNHELLHLDLTATNIELLQKSVISHVIALNASIPVDSSPLAYMLQNLNQCSSLYILTCPSDVESVLISAVLQIGGQVTRYSCSCGYKYVIANCGMANGIGKCPECRATIGGTDHVIAAGQKRLDSKPITRAITANDQVGYICETGNTEISQSIRLLNPTSYRILHLFVHAIIGARAPSQIVTGFLQKNSDTVNDPSTYCMDHIKNDWIVLKRILNLSDENLALLLHSILDSMTKQPPKNSTLKKRVDREEWEANFSRNYVEPAVRSSTVTATDFGLEISKAETNSQESVNIIEVEINQTLQFDKEYNMQHLPMLWRTIEDINFESFRAFYSGDLSKNAENYPFLSIFFKHEQQLSFVKYLLPIIKFVRILSSKLEYRVNRVQAQLLTFQEFIANSEDSTEVNNNNNLKVAFEDFAQAWNSVINHVKNYQCHELPSTKPLIDIESPITFGLIEPKDTGVYICAILEYLIGIQNNFLQEVATITPGKCHSLVFLEDGLFNNKDPNVTTSSKSAKAVTQYYIQSMMIEQIQPNNVVNFQWNDDILQYSQRNLRVGRGQDVTFNLQKIESELANSLVYEKVFIGTVNDSQLYMEPFTYHMELFQGYIRILGEIKDLIPQQSIPTEKVALILSTSISSSGYQYLTFDNASELLSSLEILLCFVKKTLVGDGEILIDEYVNQWMKLSNLLDNESFVGILNASLKLKHLVALYELVEEQVANGVIKYIDDKYKETLTPELEHDITSAISYESSEEYYSLSSTNIDNEQTKIPAEHFASALKRFMLRFLNKNSNKATEPMSIYFSDMTLNLWSPGVSEEMVDNFFPDSLLVAHIYEAYIFVNSKLETIKKQTPIVTRTTAIAPPPVTKILTTGKKRVVKSASSSSSSTVKKSLKPSTFGVRYTTVTNSGNSSSNSSNKTVTNNKTSTTGSSSRSKFGSK